MANGLQIAASGLDRPGMAARRGRERHRERRHRRLPAVAHRVLRGARRKRRRPLRRRRHDRRGRRARTERQPARDRARRPRLHPGAHGRRRTALTRDGDLRIDGARKLAISSGAKLDPPITFRTTSSATDISIAPRRHRHRRPAASSARSRSSTCRRPTRSHASSDGLLTTTAASGAAGPHRTPRSSRACSSSRTSTSPRPSPR